MERFAQAIEKSGVDVVPKILMGGAGEGGNLMEGLLNVLLSEKLNGMLSKVQTEGSEVKAANDPNSLRNQLRAELQEKPQTPQA